MTQSQMIHVGMINSYNILMGKANIDEVLIIICGVQA